MERIEEVQFFFKEMKSIYLLDQKYFGHKQFMDIMAFVMLSKDKVDKNPDPSKYACEGKLMRQRKLRAKS